MGRARIEKTPMQVRLVDIDFKVLPYGRQYGEAYGRVTFNVILPDGTEQPICENMGSSKGKVTAEQKIEMLNELNRQIKSRICYFSIIKEVKVYDFTRKGNPYYNANHTDPIFLEVNSILNGNR